MSVFMYYFPGYGGTKSQLTREDVRRTFARESLWDVLHTPGRYAAHTVTNILRHGGPDNGVGTVLTCQSGNEEIPGFLPGYYPDRQTWVKVGGEKTEEQAADKDSEKTPHPGPLPGVPGRGNEECWLGWYNEAPLRPDPESLRRLWPIKGEMVELADGNLWEAPVIRTGPKTGVTLPQILSLQDDDSVEMETMPEFAEFLGLADRIWDHYWGIDGRTMTLPEIMKSVVKCLNLNYRVSRPEVRALRLLSGQNWKDVLRASNNFTVLEELMGDGEKKESAVVPSEPSAGPEASTIAGEASQSSTSPVSAT